MLPVLYSQVEVHHSMAASEGNPKPLPCGAEQLETLAAQHGTPFHLYDGAGMEDGVAALMHEFKAAGFIFSQFFAVKALPNPAVLATLVKAGCGLDCSSTAELYIARKLGVPGSQIMYTSNYTSKVRTLWGLLQSNAGTTKFRPPPTTGRPGMGSKPRSHP